MSEDKQVMEMVNEHAARALERRCASPEGIATPVCALARNDRKNRAFLLMAIKALLWVLAGAVILALMVSNQIAVWLAASCTCVCVVAAAIRVDRHFRRR